MFVKDTTLPRIERWCWKIGDCFLFWYNEQLLHNQIIRSWYCWLALIGVWHGAVGCSQANLLARWPQASCEKHSHHLDFPPDWQLEMGNDRNCNDKCMASWKVSRIAIALRFRRYRGIRCWLSPMYMLNFRVLVGFGRLRYLYHTKKNDSFRICS